jgi:hypothetical protein
VDKAVRPFRFLAAFQSVVDGATLAETAAPNRSAFPRSSSRIT